MLNNFIKYLIDQGYKQTTPSGKPSTVYDYAKRIDKVCQYEEISLTDLTENISAIVKKYDVGGESEHIGEMSHRAVINALKRYQEFVGRKGAV